MISLTSSGSRRVLHSFCTSQSDTGRTISPCGQGPQHSQTPPAKTVIPRAPQSPALSTQDKGKLRFSGLIARMPAKGRDRDFFVPAPSASVPGERLITDLALCGQPWLTLFAQVAELTKTKSGILGDFGQ